MRILICDDDSEIVIQLRKLIISFFRKMGVGLPEIAIYTSGDELLKHETRADIAFLDVEMPGISGINTGAKLMEKNPRIKIFIVTSYPDYLDEAMRFHVFRYLSKPIDKHRLFRNLKDAIYQYNMETTEYAISTYDGVFKRQAEEIVCVESIQRKILIYTTEEIFRSTETMEYWKNILSLPCFYSPHRSYIVNMRYVFSLQKDTVILKFKSLEKEAYVTKRKYSEFRDAYLMYLESLK